ncbi:MAG TPA: nucleotide exchange factor GrpE [Acetobacteraceae bacterium]|nr:nucleotide exchange factor GrpE [Acetobacteraceae bacterium]
MSEKTETNASAAGEGELDSRTGAPEEVAGAERLQELEAERDEYKDKWMRSEAELANLRARTRREVEDARLYAVQKFARDVVEAAENLRRGIDSLPSPEPGEPAVVTKLREGFEGTERSFIALLERNGITAQDPTGATFDANLHQAMAEQPTAEAPPGTVLQAWTRTWLLNGRLLKPAMVVVAKAPEAAAGTQDAYRNGMRTDTIA